MTVDRGHVDFAIVPPTHKGALEGLPDTELQAQSNQFYVVCGPKLGTLREENLMSHPSPRWVGHSLCLEGLAEMSALAGAEFW